MSQDSNTFFFIYYSPVNSELEICVDMEPKPGWHQHSEDDYTVYY